MKLIKNYEKDTRSILFMQIFDEVFKSFYFPWRIEELEVALSDNNTVEFDEVNKKGKITFDYDNDFIKNMDERGIRSIILHNLYHLIMKINGISYDNIFAKSDEEKRIIKAMENFIVDREVAKHYPDLAFYKKCYEAIKIEPNDFISWIEANLCWLTFYGIDEWNADFIKSFLENKVSFLDYEFLQRLCEIIDTLKDEIKTKDNVEKILAEILNWKK